MARAAGRPSSSSSAGRGNGEIPAPGGAEHAEQQGRGARGHPAGGQPGGPLLVAGHDPADRAPAELGEQGGHAGQVDRGRGGQRRGHAVEPALVGQDHRGRLGQVIARGPGHRPVGGRGQLAGLAGRAEEERDGAGVEAVPQDRERQAGQGQVRLGGGVVAHGREERVGAGALVTRVQDAPRARRPGRVDRRGVLGHRGPAGLTGRDDEHLGGALEGAGQGTRVGEVAVAHPHAAGGQAGGAGRVADADPHLARRYALEQLADGLSAELAGRAGNDDHACLRVISGIIITIS